VQLSYICLYFIQFYLLIDRLAAGTGANVWVELSGKDGTSGEQILQNSLDNFKRGRVDKFDFECGSFDVIVIFANILSFTLFIVALGSLEKIRVWHDNKGLGAGWLLDKIVVRDNSGGGDGKAKDFYFLNNGKLWHAVYSMILNFLCCRKMVG
jgi:hypothetical protein